MANTSSVRAAIEARKQKQAVAPSNVVTNAKTAAAPLPKLNTSTATPPKTTESKPVTPQAQSFLQSANYIKQNVSQSDARKMTNDIIDIRNAQNTGNVQQKPLASNIVDKAAIIKGRGQELTAPKPTPTVNPKQQPISESPATAAATNVSTANNTVDNIAKDSNDYMKQLDDLRNANLEGEEGYRDALIQGAEDRFNAEQRSLDKLQGVQDQSLAARNELLQSGTDIQRKDAEDAYNKAKAEYDLQRERLDKAYQDRILEQKSSNTERQLQAESRLAALGGYGSLVKNNELQKLTIENDRLLNSLTFEKYAADKEITNNLVGIANDYQSNLSKIEQGKQEQIQSNYDKYLEYVTKIQGDREMSIVNKQSAIKEAQEAYKKNVAKINQDSFDQKYEISEKMAAQARDIKEKDQSDARETLQQVLSTFAMSDQELTPLQQKQIAELEKRAGFPTGLASTGLKALKEQAKAENLDIQQIADDEGNITYVAVDKATGQIKNYETVKGIGKATQGKFSISYNPLTGESVIVNNQTGQTRSGGGQGFSTFGGQEAPPGTQIMGGKIIDNKEFNSALNVGKNVGLWCGVYASTISTARRVGNTWNEKLNAIDKKDNPKAGDKLLVPLGVKTDGAGKMSGWGHVAVVTNYDPTTGDITVVESNKDGKKRTDNDGYGTVTTGVYNLNKLRQSYGENFGFASGDFKPEIKKQLEQGVVPNSQNMMTQMGGGDNVVNKLMAQGLPAKYAYEAAQKLLEKQFDKTATTSGGGFDKDIFQAEGALRDDFTKNTQNYTKIRDAYNTIKTTAAKPSAANDLSLIFAYMKMLDPNSTVREGEFANAQNAAGVPVQIQNQWNKLKTGERLAETQRKEFVSAAEDLYGVSKQGYDQQVAQYKQLAKGYGLDPNKAVIDYTIPDSSSMGGNNWLSGLSKLFGSQPSNAAPVSDDDLWNSF